MNPFSDRLGETDSFSTQAGERYISYFGPRNHHVSIGNHTLLFVDSVSLVEEDFIRADRGYSYDHWHAVAGGPVDFVKRFASNEHANPIVLFTHIPLARPLGTDCGSLRERGTIRQGWGFGYQNTLSYEASQFLLGSVRPSLILRFVVPMFTQIQWLSGITFTAAMTTTIVNVHTLCPCHPLLAQRQ